MDLDDLDVPNNAPTRPAGRFAPKGSKFQPKPKTKTEPPASSSSAPVQSKEEVDSKPLLGLNFASTSKTEPSDLPSVENDAVAMDIEAKAEVKEDADAMEMDGEEDDQVVREIDVYFSPSVDAETKLYVLQYPLRPLWRPYELDERCEEVRVKPDSGEVEIDLAVDVDSKNYDSDADPTIRMTKQTLSSSWRPPAQTGYTIGVLTGNKLYLNPIHAVVQLRPSLQHLKPEGSKKKNVAKNDLEDAIKEEPEEVKPKGTLKKQSKMPGSSSEQDKNVQEWVPLKYHGARSDISIRYLRKMIEEESFPIQFLMSPNDYVNALCPGTSDDSLKSSGPSRRFLLSLPLEERYKAWLVQGPPVHRFDALKHLAPDESVEEILRVLQKHAQLVQGLWVPKSTLLFGKGQEMKTFARDNILVLFSKMLIISNTQLPQSPQQLVNAARDILNALAVERPSLNDWKFKEPPDMTFIKLYPEIVKEQEEGLERLEKQISEFFGKNKPGMKSIFKSSNPSNRATSKVSDKAPASTANGSLLRKPMSEETREALPKALVKVLQHQKVCSFQQIRKCLRDMAVSESNLPKRFAREAVAAANGVDAPPEELQAIISEVAINIHGAYVLRSLPDYPHNDLRKIVIDLLIAEGPDAKLKKASICEAAKLQLKREIKNDEYQKVLQELCVSKGSAWVLRSGDGTPK